MEPGTLLSGAHYNAYGEMISAALGNTLMQVNSFDARGRVTSSGAGPTACNPISNPSACVYAFAGMGYNPDTTLANTNDSINGGWAYTYDDFNRLATAAKGANTYAYQYDRYGNRWNWSLNSVAQQQVSFQPTNNRIAAGNGVTYDAAGNVITDGANNYTYDAENRMITAPGASYVYDADGQRVRKTVSGVSSDYLYDLFGHMTTVLNSGGGWIRGEAYAGGQHLATYANSTVYFAHADWLGTERRRTDIYGSGVNASVIPYADCTSLPFGDGMTCTGVATGASSIDFTGDEHDAESGPGAHPIPAAWDQLGPLALA